MTRHEIIQETSLHAYHKNQYGCLEQQTDIKDSHEKSDK